MRWCGWICNHCWSLDFQSYFRHMTTAGGQKFAEASSSSRSCAQDHCLWWMMLNDVSSVYHPLLLVSLMQCCSVSCFCRQHWLCRRICIAIDLTTTDAAASYFFRFLANKWITALIVALFNSCHFIFFTFTYLVKIDYCLTLALKTQNLLVSKIISTLVCFYTHRTHCTCINRLKPLLVYVMHAVDTFSI